MEQDINWDSIKLLENEDAFSGIVLYLSHKATTINISTEFLNTLSNPDIRNKYYQTFMIPKKLGGERCIETPGRRLKSIQREILKKLSHEIHEHKCAHGFVKGKDIKSNAKLHVKKQFVYVIDLKDFFPSITWKRIYGMFQSFPFNASKDIARIMSNLVTFNEHLPQGAPTSPYLSNMICRKLDSRLLKWAADNNYTYSRYADDLTFSTLNKNCFPKKDRDFIEKIIADENFEINQSKKRLIPYFKRQIVTGVVVNKKVNIKKNYIRKIRAILHNVEKFGIESQLKRDHFFEEHKEYIPFKNEKVSKKRYLLINDEQNKKELLINGSEDLNIYLDERNDPQMIGAVNKFRHKLRGMIEFVGLVKGKESAVYTNYISTYDKVMFETKHKTSTASTL